MPAPQRYPTPAEQLLHLAQSARAAGIPFDEFWDRAIPPPEPIPDTRGRPIEPKPLEDEEGNVKIRPSRVLPRVGADDPPEGAVLWPRDTRERRDSYEAAVESRDVWRRAYEGTPASPREQALVALRPLLERLAAKEAEEAEDEESEGSPSRPGVPLLA